MTDTRHTASRVWKVEIVETETDAVVRSMSYASEHLADKAERGALRNLNTEKFYTRTVAPVTDEQHLGENHGR